MANLKKINKILTNCLFDYHIFNNHHKYNLHLLNGYSKFQ